MINLRKPTKPKPTSITFEDDIVYILDLKSYTQEYIYLQMKFIYDKYGFRFDSNSKYYHSEGESDFYNELEDFKCITIYNGLTYWSSSKPDEIERKYNSDRQAYIYSSPNKFKILDIGKII